MVCATVLRRNDGVYRFLKVNKYNEHTNESRTQKKHDRISAPSDPTERPADRSNSNSARLTCACACVAVGLLSLDLLLLYILEHLARVARPILSKIMISQDMKHLYIECMKGRNKCTLKSLNMKNYCSYISSVQSL
jgi:hypothetical protein